MSVSEAFPREADLPVKSRMSSINWNANPWEVKKEENKREDYDTNFQI